MVQCNAGTAQSSDDFRGGGRPAPGQYHVIINVGKEVVSEKDTPGTEIEFQVLAGTVPGQEGTVVVETFWQTERAISRLLAFAMSCGVLRPGENKDVSGPDYNGLQLVIEVQPRKYTDSEGNEKETVEVSYNGFWEVGHPEVKDVPKDQNTIQQIGQVAQQPTAVGGPPAQTVPQHALADNTVQPGPVATPPQQQPPQQTAPPTTQATPAAPGQDWLSVQ